MPRRFTVQPAERKTIKAAAKLCRKRAAAALGTNRSLNFTQGIQEASNLEGSCEELTKAVDAMVGSSIELSTSQTDAARTALGVYLKELEKKETDTISLLAEEDGFEVDALQDGIDKAKRLERVFSKQGDSFTPESVPVPDKKPDAIAAQPDSAKQLKSKLSAAKAPAKKAAKPGGKRK